MIHCACSGIEYFLCSVGLLAEYFVVILLVRQHCNDKNNNQSLGTSLLSFIV